MLTHFESKIWECEHYDVKQLLRNFHFGKVFGFSKIGHFFCPFLTFANTFAHSIFPKNRYYS
jgi:hypothetical protein